MGYDFCMPDFCPIFHLFYDEFAEVGVSENLLSLILKEIGIDKTRWEALWD